MREEEIELEKKSRYEANVESGADLSKNSNPYPKPNSNSNIIEGEASKDGSSAGPAHSRGLEAVKNKEYQSAAAYFREVYGSRNLNSNFNADPNSHRRPLGWTLVTSLRTPNWRLF